MPQERPVKQIQEELMTRVEELRTMAKQLRLVELMTELERNYPQDMDTEQVGEGDICPPLAWEMHADVGNAKILLEEVIDSLAKASRQTEQEVQREWIITKLRDISDPATRYLLAFCCGNPGDIAE